MPNFNYTVKNSSGKTIKESATAVNKEILIGQLQQQGYFILAVEEVVSGQARSNDPEIKIKSNRKFARRGIGIQDRLLFARQLATMLESGVNLLRSLNVIVEQTESENFYKILTKIRNDVEQGISFSVALSRHPKAFDSLWVSLIEVGEASGTMPLVLSKLAFYVERAEAFRSAIVSAMIYPGILLGVSFSAILIFALFIGPKFQQMYESMNATLPPLTANMLNLFSFMKAKFLLIFGSICAIFVVARKYVETPIGRLQFESLVFKLPVAGDMVKTAVVEKFASQMSILVESGVPILYALDIIERLIDNKICEGIIAQVKGRVREGKLISEEMAKSHFFPAMATQMIAIGEETGELGKMLNHIAEYYQRELQTFTHRFATMFEPIILIFMGVTIGTMVLAMFLPIFNLASGGMGG